MQTKVYLQLHTKAKGRSMLTAGIIDDRDSTVHTELGFQNKLKRTHERGRLGIVWTDKLMLNP